MSTEKRKNQVTMGGNPVTLIGEEIRVGDDAQNFEAIKQDLSVFDFYNDTKGKIKLISVVPSIDTGVCELQTKRFNQEAAALSRDVEIITISTDLPFAHKRFCAAQGIEQIQLVSDHKTLDFGTKYGFSVEEFRLLARGIVIIDAQNKVQYVEYVKEITNHPDYEKALLKVETLAGK